MDERPVLRVAEAPPSPGSRTNWAWVADQVRGHYPDWVCVGTFSSAIGWRMRKGRYQDIPPEEFEITSRRADEEGRRYDLWLRYRDPERPSA